MGYQVHACALNPEAVAKRIKLPLKKWAGNCTGVCSRILQAKVVQGELRRGLWIGFISPQSTFSHRPFAGHTWIRLPDGHIYDPTRFAFFADAPSIYVSEEKEEKYPEVYDFGGNSIRRAFRHPFPCAVEPASKWLTVRVLKSTADLLVTLAGKGSGLTASSTTKQLNGAYARLRLTWSQAAWLANCTLDELGGAAGDYFRALIKLGHGCMIPFDNQHEVLKRKEGKKP